MYVRQVGYLEGQSTQLAQYQNHYLFESATCSPAVSNIIRITAPASDCNGTNLLPLQNPLIPSCFQIFEQKPRKLSLEFNRILLLRTMSMGQQMHPATAAQRYAMKAFCSIDLAAYFALSQIPLKLPLKTAVPIKEFKNPWQKQRGPWFFKIPLTVDPSFPSFSVLVPRDCLTISKGQRMEEAVQPASTAIPMFRLTEFWADDCRKSLALQLMHSLGKNLRMLTVLPFQKERRPSFCAMEVTQWRMDEQFSLIFPVLSSSWVVWSLSLMISMGLVAVRTEMMAAVSPILLISIYYL